MQKPDYFSSLIMSKKKWQLGCLKYQFVCNLIPLVTEGHMQKIKTLEQTLPGEKKGTRRENNAVISGHYILPARPKGSVNTSFALIIGLYWSSLCS